MWAAAALGNCRTETIEMGAMEIELVRGTRRRKHVEAELVGDRLRVSFPRWMSLADAQEAAEELAERARGFLVAKDLAPDEFAGCDEPPLLTGDVRP